LDIHTLHIEHVVLLALYTLITVANSWLYKGVKGIHWFSLYNLAALLGAIAVALRGHIPDFISIVVGNLFVVVGYFFFTVSLTTFFGRKTYHFYLQGVFFLTAVVTMLQYGWVHNDTPKRLIAYSVILGAQQVHLVLFLLSRKSTALRVATNSMMFMLIGLALGNLTRIIGVAMRGAPNNYLDAGSFLAWIVVVNSCLQCGTMVSYVWMTAAYLREDLEIQAITDPLTGLLNRRGIEIAAEQHILACNRAHLPISAIILDLNDFKQINDTYGHHCGDAALMAVATCLQNGTRNNNPKRKRDLLARVGGDEFAILLPETAFEATAEIAMRLRSSIEQTDIVYGQVRTRVTASFGLAQLQPASSTWEQLIMNCDKALYEAKRARGSSTLPRTPPSSKLSFADPKLG